MKALTLLLVCACLIACETPSSATDTGRLPPALRRQGVTIGGGNGLSFDTEVVIHAPNQEAGIVSEHEYIDARYPLSQFIGQDLVDHKGKHYDVLTYQSSDGNKHVFYFDMSDYYGKLP